jgi:hypothetical protein
MSEATEYLGRQVDLAATSLPILTFVTCQRVQVPPPDFKPGIASYGWGVNGRIEMNGAGSPTGLRFGSVYQWFSDRISNLDRAQFPSDWQQFDVAGRDQSDLTLTLAGDQVELAWHSRTWGNTWTSLTPTFDSPSEQLIFGVPGAGRGAPPAVMFVSITPHGHVVWL